LVECPAKDPSGRWQLFSRFAEPVARANAGDRPFCRSISLAAWLSLNVSQKMKRSIILLFVIAVSGCTFPVLDEINYRGAPLTKGSDSYAPALAFARQWASESGLEISGEVRPSDHRKDEAAIIELHASKWPKLRATVLVNGEYGILCATVAPATGIPAAAELASGAVRAYKKLYPESLFEHFEAHQGLLGP